MNARWIRPLLAPALWVSVLLGCAPRTTDGFATRTSGDAAQQTVSPEHLAERGLELLARGEHVRAEQYLQLALRAGHPERPLIVPLLTSCVASSRFRSALAHAERYLGRHEQAWDVRFIKSVLHRALGQPHEAELELERALQDAPAEARASLRPRRTEVSTTRPVRRARGAER